MKEGSTRQPFLYRAGQGEVGLFREDNSSKICIFSPDPLSPLPDGFEYLHGAGRGKGGVL